MDSLTQAILDATAARSLNDRQVAELAGITRQAVFRARHGQKAFGRETLVAIASALGLRWALVPDGDLVPGPRRDERPKPQGIPSEPLRGTFRFADPVNVIRRRDAGEDSKGRPVYDYLDGQDVVLLRKSPIRYVVWWCLRLPGQPRRCLRLSTKEAPKVPDDVAPPAWLPHLKLEGVQDA